MQSITASVAWHLQHGADFNIEKAEKKKATKKRPRSPNLESLKEQLLFSPEKTSDEPKIELAALLENVRKP